MIQSVCRSRRCETTAGAFPASARRRSLALLNESQAVVNYPVTILDLTYEPTAHGRVLETLDDVVSKNERRDTDRRIGSGHVFRGLFTDVGHELTHALHLRFLRRAGAFDDAASCQPHEVTARQMSEVSLPSPVLGAAPCRYGEHPGDENR